MRATTLGLLFTSSIAVSAANDAEIPLGVEVVTGYRSAYILRGTKLADNVMDVQLQSEIALSNHWLLNLGGWYATATGSGNFTEASGFAEIAFKQDDWITAFNVTGRSFENSPNRSGFEFGPSITRHFSEDFELTAGLLYDQAGKGGYAYTEAHWSKAVTDSSFVSILGGVSAVSNYYDRNGGNDFYGRISYTYNLNKTVSLTPFAGVSIPYGANSTDTKGYAGLWFEVNF